MYTLLKVIQRVIFIIHPSSSRPCRGTKKISSSIIPFVYSLSIFLKCLLSGKGWVRDYGRRSPGLFMKDGLSSVSVHPG